MSSGILQEVETARNRMLDHSEIFVALAGERKAKANSQTCEALALERSEALIVTASKHTSLEVMPKLIFSLAVLSLLVGGWLFCFTFVTQGEILISVSVFALVIAGVAGIRISEWQKLSKTS